MERHREAPGPRRGAGWRLMNFDEIERILELMRTHDLIEFELEVTD
jgi:hypothetical protein